MTMMIGRSRTFVEDFNINTSVMKTKTTYPANANKTKALLVAVLILIQAALIASDSSDVNRENETKKGYFEYNAIPVALNLENAYYYLNEEAPEDEYEIEDWMCTIYKDSFNYQSDEEEIELEEWMYDIKHSFWLDLNDAKESELVIESWMTKPNDWIDTSEDLMLTSK